MEVIDATRRRLVMRFGHGVTGWCDGLQARIDRLARRRKLSPGRPVSRGLTSCVLLCERATGEPVVLKLFPDRDLISAEAGALAA